MTHDEIEPKRWEVAKETGPLDDPDPEVTPGGKLFPLGRIIALAGGFLVLSILVYVLFLYQGNQTKQPPATEASGPLAEPNSQPGDRTATVTRSQPLQPPVVPLSVSLQESDPAVREKASAISGYDGLGGLLAESDFIRRFVTVCNAIALGESPAKMLESLAPKQIMTVLRQPDGRIFMDPAGYNRYTPLIQLLLSLDPDQCAELYLLFEPQIGKAYHELGQGDEDFIQVLKEAVRQLHRTPLPPERPELLEKTISYAYADPQLEGLNDAQKHFLRLGPDHLRRLKAKIGILLDALLARKGL
jgi:hypothetical protein